MVAMKSMQIYGITKQKEQVGHSVAMKSEG